MNSNLRLRQTLLLLGDIVLLYASLLITLFLRYGTYFWGELTSRHLEPFSIVFISWILIFYIAGLYDLRILKNTLTLLKILAVAIVASAFLTIIFFYLIPRFGITPKINLVLFVIVFGILAFFWRRFFNRTLNKVLPTIRLLLIGNDSEYEELIKQIEKNPQLGYKVSFWLKNATEEEIKNLSQIIADNAIDSLVLPLSFKREQGLAQIIFRNISPVLEIIDLPQLYERVFQKVPLSALEEVWFIENITRGKRALYELVKRTIEIIFALLIGILFLPLAFIIASSIKIISAGGPVIYRQKRVGKNRREFSLYKFRTMIPDAEAKGPGWTIPNDPRITKIGKVLRRTRLDEIPQLINLLRGNLALVGPRPESSELVNIYQKKLPFYEIRYIMKPGITGWAQVNYKPSASIEEAYEKLQYDIYYIKNRSFVLDFLIILRTIKYFFTSRPLQ